MIIMKKQEDYDKEFLRLAIDICNKINKVENSKEFTFGNAQKLINMMCKYFYILVYNDESLRKHLYVVIAQWTVLCWISYGEKELKTGKINTEYLEKTLRIVGE